MKDKIVKICEEIGIEEVSFSDITTSYGSLKRDGVVNIKTSSNKILELLQRLEAERIEVYVETPQSGSALLCPVAKVKDAWKNYTLEDFQKDFRC